MTSFFNRILALVLGATLGGTVAATAQVTSGIGSRTAVLGRFIDGTISAPSMSFTSQSTVGWYRAGSNDVRLAIASADILKATATGLTVTGFGSFTTSVAGLSFTTQDTTGSFYVSGRSGWLSSADKLFQFDANSATTGAELNVGTPTLGTCTAGSLTSGSHNFAGQYTGNTSGSCVINFGTPAYTNTPYCFAMSIASTTHPRISASSASSITVTGGVSGETIQFFCAARIGT